MAAYAMVTVAAFGTACACGWMIRPIPPRARWQAAILLVFLFYYAAPLLAEAIGPRWPATLDPGASLRPLRGFLPFLVLPFFVVLMRRALVKDRALAPGLTLGLVAGAGLLWSNDAGLPLVIALTIGLGLALHHRPGLLVRMLGAVAAGTVASAGAILFAVTHAAPGPWLAYNFRDVAGDQFWYFAPWERSTRILGVADLPNILLHADPFCAASLVVLALCVGFAAIQRLRGRSAPVRGSAFVFVGASVLGTALVPQIGGHVGPEYNAITFVLGCCAPLIVAPARLWRKVLRVLRAVSSRHLAVLTGGAALAMVGLDAKLLAATEASTERTAYDPALGFYVTPAYAEDLAAMRQLAGHWDGQGIPADRRLLSVYTSTLDVAAGTESPAPVGSLIHALGPRNRADFKALVAGRKVAAVTTLAPDYKGWEGWLLRANWPFFRALGENYVPVARTDQHVLWLAAEQPTPRAALGAASCRIAALAPGRMMLSVTAARQGLAAITLSRRQPFATGRGAMLTVTEASPATAAGVQEPWGGFPRYGIANTPRIELVAPVTPGRATTLTIEVLDGTPFGAASCTAEVLPVTDLTALPRLADGIPARLAGGRP
jgi:hypothetical protein